MSNRRYDIQFKAEVISLALTSDIPRTQLAIDLGVNYKTLCNWIKQAMTNKRNIQNTSTSPRNKKPDYQELEQQNKLMCKELALRKQEIEILKKAAKYAFIPAVNDLPKNKLFRLFNVSSSGYYDWLKRKPS